MTINNRGLVYYALDATRLAMRVKIGTSTRLDDRLDQLKLQTASRQRPILLAVEVGGEQLEAERHAQFREYRLAGEWFHYYGLLADFIAGLSNPLALLADSPELWQFAKGVPGVPRIPIEEADKLDPVGEIEF